MKDAVILARSVFDGEVIFDSIQKTAYHKRNDEKDIMVCLTCTKKVCKGESGCFQRRKRQLEKEAAG